MPLGHIENTVPSIGKYALIAPRTDKMQNYPFPREMIYYQADTHVILVSEP